jgi:hypothetical protein
MTFMKPNGKGGRQMAFMRLYVMSPGAPLHKEPQAEVIARMLDWLDTSPFGRTLFLEDINWAVFPHSESSIVADLTLEEYCILKLAAPTGSVRFRKEAEVRIPMTSRERNLSEPERMPTQPRLTPKPQPECTIVKKRARFRQDLGPRAYPSASSASRLRRAG